MEQTRILIVDDEKEIRNILKEYLTSQKFDVWEAEDGRQAISLFEESEFDLVLVDIMMPGINGWEVCRKIRETSKIPIVILSAKGEEYDKLKGFELGVDDYIVKPFSPRELVARIKAILRRKDDPSDNKAGTRFIYKTLEVDFESNNVLIDGEKVKMTPREYNLLEFLIINKNIVLSRDKLLDGVWGMDFFGDDRTVDSHIKSLRENLGIYRDLVATVWGKGYKFEVSEKYEKS